MDADALVDHAFHVREARDALFAEFAEDHRMAFYGEPSPRLAELVDRIGVNVTWFTLLQALEPAGVRLREGGEPCRPSTSGDGVPGQQAGGGHRGFPRRQEPRKQHRVPAAAGARLRGLRGQPERSRSRGIGPTADLRSIPGGVQAVVIATRPEIAEDTMRECAELGIKHVWMHRGPGAGSVSAAATDYGRQHGITVIDGGCPLMFGPTADLGHKRHALHLRRQRAESRCDRRAIALKGGWHVHRRRGETPATPLKNARWHHRVCATGLVAEPSCRDLRDHGLVGAWRCVDLGVSTPSDPKSTASSRCTRDRSRCRQ